MLQKLTLEGFLRSLSALGQSQKTPIRTYLDGECIVVQFPEGFTRRMSEFDDIDHLHCGQNARPEDETEEEPITAVAAWRAGKHIGRGNPNHARKFLGLSIDDASLIAEASRSDTRQPELRQRILFALRGY